MLARARDDLAFAAHMLTPPIESELAMAMAVIDPDAIHAARVTLIRTIAAAHGETFAALYESLASAEPFSPDAASAGRRALRNACLRYLTAADDENAAALGRRALPRGHQHDRHDRGPCRAFAHGLAARDAAFAHFHDRFANDPLVLDKWMGLQAGSSRADTVERVRALMNHPAFDISNPNRVRALVGAFSSTTCASTAPTARATRWSAKPSARSTR